MYAGVEWGITLLGEVGSQKYLRNRPKKSRRGSRSYTMNSMCAVSVRDTASWKHVSWKSEEFKASESQLLWNIVLYYHNSNSKAKSLITTAYR